MYGNSLFFYGELLNLKYFSFTCELETLLYDEALLPLLYRMSKLEELLLNILVVCSTFIDGNTLKNDIVSRMSYLNKFVFSIHSAVYNLTQLPSNQDIQHTFTSIGDYQIISYIDYFRTKKFGQCHIYSQPYTMNCLYRLSNSFQGGLFKFVHTVSLLDERPFEYKFFIRIAQAFPYLKILIMYNHSPQNHKQRQQSNGDSRNLPIIEYPHLTELFLWSAHDDYIEQFLDDTKTCLSN